MHKEVLSAIVGIEVFPAFSLVLFVCFFSGVLVWAFKADRKHIDHLAALPLDDNDQPASNHAATH